MAAITVMDPGRPDYLRAVRIRLWTGVYVGVFVLVVPLLGWGDKYTLSTPEPLLSPGIWVPLAIGGCAFVGWLVGRSSFRPHRYTLQDDCLTRERSASQMTSVERITKVEWSSGALKGVRITSSIFTCTLTVREETRPLLHALGESLTRLNLLDKLRGGEHLEDLRLALGLNEEIAAGELSTTEGQTGGPQGTQPGFPPPQDRPASPQDRPAVRPSTNT
jgi:hypothetical protein